MFTFAAPNRAQAVPFFLLSANAQGDNWYYSPYFGRYNISYYPYIYKDCFGWLYWYGEVGDNGGGWFYDYNTGDYFWTSAGTYRYDLDPQQTYFYSNNLGVWLYYFEPKLGWKRYRDFYNTATKVYFSYPLNIEVCPTCSYD